MLVVETHVRRKHPHLLRLPWRRVCGPLPIEKDQDIEILELLRAGEHAARVREVPSEAHFELTFLHFFRFPLLNLKWYRYGVVRKVVA